MQIKGYQIVMERSGDEYVASVPALPGCSLVGDTEGEALAGLPEAIDAWIAMAVKLGRKVPARHPIYA